MTSNIYKFSAIKISQPIGDFFVTKIPCSIITSCTKADIRRVIDANENISGIQREKTKSRVNEIKNYVKTVDSSFPNSVILNLNSKYIKKREIIRSKIIGIHDSTYIFEIVRSVDTFNIVDGQHRLSGLKEAVEEQFKENFDIIVSFFVDLDKKDQAYLFSTINSKHSKVSRSLLMDLFELQDVRSPDRCAHLITKSLNSNELSPLYHRISLLGKAPRFENDLLYRTVLTQGTVASKISKLMSENSSDDRDKIMRNKNLELGNNYVKSGQIFRKYFIDQDDNLMLTTLFNYFSAVKAAFPQEWTDLKNPLSKAIGFGALMLFLVEIYKYAETIEVPTYQYFLKIMLKAKENYDADEINMLEFKVYQAAGSGERKLFNDLVEWSEIKKG